MADPNKKISSKNGKSRSTRQQVSKPDTKRPAGRMKKPANSNKAVEKSAGIQAKKK